MLQQFGSRKNVGAGSASDFLRAKRINAIRAAGDIKANTATSGYEPITIVQFNSVVQELNNLSTRSGGGAGTGNVDPPDPPLPPIGDNSFVFQVATGTAVFSFDTTAPALSDISWGGPGSLTTVVEGSQTTYQYTYSDGNQYHNVTMSNVSNVQEVSIYQSPRPAAPAFTISGVTSDALDTYTLHISSVAGATAYFLALNGTPTSIIQPAVNLSYQVEGVCGRTYTNALATVKQRRIGDFSAAQSYSIPPLPQPSLALTATGPTTFTATVSSTVLPGAKRVFEIYQLSGGTYSNVARGEGTTYSLTGAFHTNQTVYANLVYNVNSTISSATGSVLLPNTLAWVNASQMPNYAYFRADINPSSGALLTNGQNTTGVGGTNPPAAGIFRTYDLGHTYNTVCGMAGYSTLCDDVRFIQYLNRDTWFVGINGQGDRTTRLYRSINDASDWSVRTFDNFTLNSIATDGSDTIVIGGSNASGLYYSSNRGTTWVGGTGEIPRQGTGDAFLNVGKVVYTPCAWFALGTNAQKLSDAQPFTGLVYSENGMNWKTVSGAFPKEIINLGDSYTANSSPISFNQTDHIWVLGKDQRTNTSDFILMWSTNASEWHPAQTGAPHISDVNTYSLASTSVAYTNNIWLTSITTLDMNSASTISGTTSIRKSTDGKNWVTVTQPSIGFPAHFVHRPNTNQWVCGGAENYASIALGRGSNSTLFSADNGETWVNTLGDQQAFAYASAYDTSHSKWVSLGTCVSEGITNGFVTATAYD